MSKRRKKKNSYKRSSWRVRLGLIAVVFVWILIVAALYNAVPQFARGIDQAFLSQAPVKSVSLDEIPEYEGQPYVIIDDNIPEFSEEDMVTRGFEEYSSLDFLGRCGAAYANVGQDTMPTEKRGDISNVYPSGWKNEEYEFITDGGYVYNRCHLIGYQLAGENDNEKNLITGTRYMNVEGMLPFENEVAEYVEETDHHVLMRVTPIYEGTSLVASGVQMEAKSVEDNGEGVQFNVYCYNVQPGVEIDYATGDNHAEKEEQ